MNLKACSVVQRFSSVFVVVDSCYGQALSKHHLIYLFFNPLGSSEGSEFTYLLNVLVGSLAEDPFPCFFLFLSFPIGQDVDRGVYGFPPAIIVKSANVHITNSGTE